MSTEMNFINVNTNKIENLISKFTFTFCRSPYGEGTVKEHINYLGNCLDLGLIQGQYKLQIKDAYSHQGYNANVWNSETFRIGFPNAGRNVKFEFWMPYTFNDLYFYPYYLNGNKVYYQIPLQSAISYGDGTFDIFQESVQDKSNINVYGYQRFAELKSCVVLGDTNTIKNLQQLRLISNVNGSEVYFTNETGERKQIQIFDVTVDPLESSNYMKITVKYKVKDSDIRLNDKQIINLAYTQPTGVTPTTEDIKEAILKSNEKTIESHDKVIKRH